LHAATHALFQRLEGGTSYFPVDSKATIIVQPPTHIALLQSHFPFLATFSHMAVFAKHTFIFIPSHFTTQGGILLMVGGGIGLICTSVAYQQKKSGRW
jgi:hypothetical protein